ncbi:MAG: C-GCAxxG-C-C family protein, partial [Muribaculaceae bacterium]|nr:C-GCAxxG-C-C family protein [Muribaculaceae bacterium]
CGTISAIAILSGIMHPGAPTDKKDIYGKIRLISDEFKAANNFLNCIDLKTKGKRSCLELIESAVTIMHNHVATGA